ncbi:MAG: hypothetical protein P1P84_02705 [Deferrisomatales bacterium]|nr:hypothetical protein [Deferrisomatales bacterium]
MVGIQLESHERAALARVYGTPLQEVLERILATLDKGNRAQKDDVQFRWGQGRALMIEDLLSEITRQARSNVL